jgi:hypothetical protein
MEATNIKVFKTGDRDMELITFEFDGKFYIYVIVMNAHICATGIRGKTTIQKWKDEYSAEFDSRESANAYFNGIKKNNKTIKRSITTDREITIVNKYIDRLTRTSDKIKARKELQAQLETEYVEDIRKIEHELKAKRQKEIDEIENFHF